MKMNELKIDQALYQPPDDDGDDIVLTNYSYDYECDPELRELSKVIITAETPGQARAILSIYFPDLNWGGRKV